MDAKVQALYRKAAGTDNPHERDAFLAKARELDVDRVGPRVPRRRPGAWTVRRAMADLRADAGLNAFFGGSSEQRADATRPQGRCVVCGRSFPKGRTDQVYCSNAHRQRAYRERAARPPA